MKINLKLIDPRLKDYQLGYSTIGSAGIDLRAAIHNNCTLAPNDTMLIPSGIAIHINNSGYCGIILPRSGLGHKYGIILGNSLGLIDSDYQGEIFISIWNRSNNHFELNVMDRIAQLVIVPVMQVSFNVVNEFQSTSRNDNGFGSTGIA